MTDAINLHENDSAISNMSCDETQVEYFFRRELLEKRAKFRNKKTLIWPIAKNRTINNDRVAFSFKHQTQVFKCNFSTLCIYFYAHRNNKEKWSFLWYEYCFWFLLADKGTFLIDYLFLWAWLFFFSIHLFRYFVLIKCSNHFDAEKTSINVNVAVKTSFQADFMMKIHGKLNRFAVSFVHCQIESNINATWPQNEKNISTNESYLIRKGSEHCFLFVCSLQFHLKIVKCNLIYFER